jgi:hypothetical protein
VGFFRLVWHNTNSANAQQTNSSNTSSFAANISLSESDINMVLHMANGKVLDLKLALWGLSLNGVSCFY